MSQDSTLLCELHKSSKMLVCPKYFKRVLTNRTFQIALQSRFKRDCSGVVPLSRVAVDTSVGERSLSVYWDDEIARFHYLWLRHHCPCSQCVDPKTNQRVLDPTLIPDQIKPKDVGVNENILQITWDDNHRTEFDVRWLKENSYDDELRTRKSEGESNYGRIAYESKLNLWNRHDILSKPPQEFSYHDVISNNEKVLHEAMNTLFRYGFVFVNDTPVDVESTLKVGQHLVGPIRETVEGRAYIIENKALLNSDLSHFSDALQGHTDFSFYSDPPGVQIMHCTFHHGSGGMSSAVDAFNAAKTLFQEDPEAYHILSSTCLSFKSSYYQIQSTGTILELDPFSRALAKIRWNNSRIDSLVHKKMNFNEMEKFYRALKSFGSILRREENELWFKLTPGKTYVIDNRRIIHGRSAIQGPRTLIGYYISGDDYIGRWKRMNFPGKY